MSRFVRFIRSVIGLLFVWLGSLILPEPKVQKEKEPEPEKEEPLVEEAPISSLEQTPSIAYSKGVPFTDLSSYFEKLKTPGDVQSTCMMICGQLKTISEKKKAPARFNFAVKTTFNRTGEIASTVASDISGFSNHRWQKLKDLDISNLSFHVGSDRIGTLIEEMIVTMGQDGWSCMNDSSDQLCMYLMLCLKSNMNYVDTYCKRTDGTATIRVMVSLLVNDGDQQNKTFPEPMIVVKIFVGVGKEEPVESSHRVHFHRKREVSLKA